MMIEVKVKICPFCGESENGNIVVEDIASGYEDGPVYTIHCKSCECFGPSADTQKKAALLWNMTARISTHD